MNIILYNRVLSYLRAEAPDQLQKEIDRAILHFFTTTADRVW